MKFRKKPIVIDALQWKGEQDPEMKKFLDQAKEPIQICNGECLIITEEGTMVASVNDWIIKGIKGEFYPCKPDIFEDSYDKEIDKEYIYDGDENIIYIYEDHIKCERFIDSHDAPNRLEYPTSDEADKIIEEKKPSIMIIGQD